MAKQKIETSIEINGIDVVAYPLVESDHVTFENGMSINEMIKGDVSTPVVTHEEISFKVGKGDSDVSSSIVDSSVGEMIIKGQTYQNILPEPSLRNSMSKGKTMQKFNEGYDNVNVVDGVGKSAILKGCTLVNCIIDTSRKGYGAFANGIVINKDGWITAKFGNGNQHFELKMDNLNIKTSTKYLFVFECESNSFEGSGATLMIGNTYPSVVDSPWNEQKRIVALPVGITKFTLSTKSDFSSLNNPIGCRSYLCVGSGEIKFRYMIIEYQDGMENWDIPYFEGMTSVKAPTVKTVGKNLFDKDNFTRDFVVSKTGTLVAQTGDGVTDYIRVLKGKTYNKKGSNSLAIYDIDKKFIKRSDSSVNRYTAESDGYIRWNIDSYNRTDGYANGLNSLQIEEGTTVTTYEPHKSNTLTTPSDLTLRRIGDVYDTLDLVSGEKVERLISFVLDNTKRYYNFIENEKTVRVSVATAHLKTKKAGKVLSTIFPRMNYSSDEEHIRLDNSLPYSNLVIGINKNRLDEVSLKGVEQFFQQNNYEVLLELDEPIITQIPLSSSGNWEKVVLDGSEDWFNGDSSWRNRLFGTLKSDIYINFNSVGSPNVFSDSLRSSVMNELCNGSTLKTGISNFNDSIFVSMEGINSIAELQSYLRANPITVWYQTTTHKDSTQVKQPLSFSNGHVQLSSKEGSLIPSLDYEVPTSNSYHLDLAKTSTQYTMKNMSGTFTIDNNNYNASANSAFTTPTSMANKLMITSVVQSNVMLLEGDLTSKTIPYFKGIKSAFEGKDKIEVLSTGRNLVNLDNAILNSNHQKVVTKVENGFNIKFTYNPNNFSGWDNAIRLRVDVKPNTNYVLSLTKIVRKDPYQGITPLPLWVSGYTWVRQGDSHHDSLTEGNLTNGLPTVMKFNSRNFNYVTLDICSTPSRPAQDGDFDIVDIQIEESSTATPYEPYKSNITKIPLSSPLRSLPNGVRDEVILDRENNKVKVIQRVGYEVLTQDGQWGAWEVVGDTMKIGRSILPHAKAWGEGVATPIPYTRDSITQPNEGVFVYRHASNSEVRVRIKQKRTGRHDIIGVCNWLKDNNVTILYELETPIITEIDLDGYPYIYKDGHIFLNSEIAPTTTMKYSINQSHQIESQNGDLIRHEKEINYLYTLIAKYVNVQYESTLLNLDLELSRA